MKKYALIYVTLLGFAFLSCEPEFESPIEESEIYQAGEVDFSKYIAVGNSLTAGFADNALYITGQENAYPNLLAQKFEFVGGGDFTLPLMSDNVGGFSNDPTIFVPRLVLAFDEIGNPNPSLYTGAAPSTDFTVNVGAVSNMGIPGAKSYHMITPGYGDAAGVLTGSANPYYVRFASAPGATVIQDVLAQEPTFFTLWLGNNDILSYATSGGLGVDQTGNPDPTTYDRRDLTDPTLFASIYEGLLAQLMANGAKGVLLNLPDVTSIPLFTFEPTLDEAQATGLTGFYQLVVGIVTQQLIAGGASLEQAQGIASQYGFEFTVGKNKRIIRTTPSQLNPLGLIRQTDELVLLTSSESGFAVIDEVVEGILVNAALGQLPSPEEAAIIIDAIDAVGLDQNYLDQAEQQAIAGVRNSLNATIRTLAEANGLAFYDVAGDLAQAASQGIPFDGGIVTSEYISGGAFSLDGVHPTPRGHAFITNGVLSAIEQTYGAQLPKVDPADFATVTLSNDVN